MLSICYICLSTDRTLQALKEPLSNWHDELCDFSIEEDYVLYCSECAYMLNKFHNFKDKCLQANKILKKWKNQNSTARTQLNQLKEQLTPSSLGFSIIKNHKVYFYKDTTENQNTSILYKRLTSPKNSISGHPLLITDTLVPQTSNFDSFMNNIYVTTANIPSTSNVTFVKDASSEEHPDVLTKSFELKIEPCQENEMQCEVKVENDVLNETETIIINELQVKNDIDSDNNNDSDHNITNDSEGEFDIKRRLSKNWDSDNSSDDEVLLKKCKKSLKTDCNIKRPKKKVIKEEAEGDIPLSKLKKKVKEVKKDTDSNRKKKAKKVKAPLKKPNLEFIKDNLSCKFGEKEIKDEDGNIIDKDSILDSLDKMHKYTLSKVERHCLGPKPFTPEALQVLSQIQKRYGNQFSSIFTTVHLTTTEQVLEEFSKRQQHESYLSSEHKCMLCYRGFKYGKLLDYHVSEYHNPERPHLCQICQMRFKDASGMRKHLAAHGVVYKCKMCPFVTNHRNVMETHYNQHNGVKHTCELCNAILNSKSSLSAHINNMHPSRYICPLCARTFASQFGASQHKLRKHSKEEVVEGPDSARCESCDVTFISPAVYQTHLNISHAEKPNADNPFASKRKVSGTRRPSDFVCRVCKKIEHSMGQMKLHFRTEHPEENTDTVSMCAQTYKHLCHVCGKGYNNLRDLNEHKNLHTNTKPFACDKCPKAFHRRLSLRIHLERHFPPTRECPHCGKKFPSAANLNNHVKMHIGLRSYTCELCSKSFLHRAALNEHVRGVHLRIRRARKHNKEQGE